MRFAKTCLPLLFGALIGVFLASNPSATAQDAAGGLPDGITTGSLVIQGGSREQGPLKLVQIGNESFVHVSNEKLGDRYVNLRHVTHLVPPKAK